MPGRPKDSNSLTHFAVSSATPHEYPLALVALLTVVSISLNDFMLNVIFINPLLIIIF